MTDQGHKFAVGDKVVYVNEFGVCFGIKTIKSLEPATTDNGPLRYHYEGSDTPWFSKSENEFQAATDEAIAHEGDGAWMQTHFGWPTTQDQLDSLLDGDPFEGER